MRIMIDTNVLISAILFPKSTINKLIEKVMTSHTLVLCSYILEEIQELFVRKFYDKTSYLNEFLLKFSYELVYTPLSINVNDYPDIRDVSDLPILASAINAEVDIIITGDKDFFDIEKTDKELPLIITPGEFIQRYM